VAGIVTMYDPETGKTVPVSASRVAQMQALGLTVDSPEAAERRTYEQSAGAGELAKSVGEGLASGATLGLSDVLESAIGGDEYRHTRALRDETFAGPHKLAEGVGMVAPLLVPGGAEIEGADAAAEGGSLLSRAAGFTPTALAARAAGGAERLVGRGLARLGEEGASKGLMRTTLEAAARHGTAGAVEGGIQGAAQGISEDELAEEHGGFDQLAESAWGGAKSGAMFGLFGGAAIGGIAGAAGGASRGLLRRFGAKGDELAEAANERAVKATGARGADLRRLGSEGKIQQVGEDIRNYTLKDGTPLLGFTDNAESLAPKLARARSEQGAEIGELRRRVAALEPNTPALEVNVGAFDRGSMRSESLDHLRAHPEDANRLGPPRIDVWPDSGPVVGDGRHRMAIAAERGDKTIKADIVHYDTEGNVIKQGTEDVSLVTRPGGNPREAVTRATPDHASFPDTAGMLQRLKSEVIDPLRMSDSGPTRRLAGQVEDQFAGLSEAAAKGEPVGLNRLLDARKDIQGRVYGLEKQLRGPNPPPAPELDHLRRAERLLDETIDRHMETKLSPEEMARYKEAKRLYSSFAPADQLGKKAVAQNIGNRFFSPTDYATGLGTGAAMLASGHPIAALGGLAVSAAHKQVRERGSAFLATLATRAQKMDGGIDRSLARYFDRMNQTTRLPRAALGGAVSGTVAGFDVAKALHAAPGEHPAAAYDRIVARAQSFATGGHAMEYALDEHAPRTGHAMRAVQMRAAEHIVKNAPVPPRKTENPNLGEMNQQMTPDPVQLYDFARRVEAINDPMSVMRDMQSGRVSMSAVEALRDVYPQTYSSIQVKIIQKLGNEPKAIPYEDRIRLGLMFGLPTDSSLRPENLALAQQTYSQQIAPPKPKNLPPVNLSKKIESQTERLETGDLAQ
jgi:hypothetical protein